MCHCVSCHSVYTYPPLFRDFQQNARDSTVVAILADDEFHQCTVTFPTDSTIVLDSGYDKSMAFDKMFTLVFAQKPMCAVLGPETPEAVQAVSLITEDIGIPQVAYGTIDERLSDAQQFPSIARPVTEIHMFVESAIRYIQRTGKERNYISLIHDLMQYGEQIEHTIFEVMDNYGVELTHHHIVHDNPHSVVNALEFVQTDGYRTIIIGTDQTAFLERIAEAAQLLEMNGPEYFYIILDLSLPSAKLASIQQEVDSPLDKLLRGAAIFRMLEPFQYVASDKFKEAWTSQGSNFVNRVNQALPGRSTDNFLETGDGESQHYVADAKHFQKGDGPSPLSSFVYDSVMLIGLSACRLSSSNQHGSDDQDFHFSAAASHHSFEHTQEILNTEFQGASGKVKFHEGENSRLYDDIVFGVYNVRPGKLDKDSGTRGYEEILTNIDKDSEWEDLGDFLFFDGTSDPPMTLRTVFEENYLPRSLMIFGLVMMSIALLIALGSGIWVIRNRRRSIVRAAQPEFIHCICIGSSLVALSIIFISFDESYGWSKDQLSAACATFPWLFVVGYLVMYCAVYCKLLRVRKVFSMNRRKVTIFQVLWPFLLILASSIVVLIAWTVIDPLRWERVVLAERPLETYGRCTSSNLVPFVVPLFLLVGIITAMVLFIAWRARDIQAEFCEWNYCFYGVFIHLQMMAVGIPLYIVLNGISKSAVHLISIFLIFIFSTTLVIAIIWPKALFMKLERRRSARSLGSANGSRRRTSTIALSSASAVRVTGLRNTRDDENNLDLTLAEFSRRASNDSMLSSGTYHGRECRRGSVETSTWAELTNSDKTLENVEEAANEERAPSGKRKHQQRRVSWDM